MVVSNIIYSNLLLSVSTVLILFGKSPYRQASTAHMEGGPAVFLNGNLIITALRQIHPDFTSTMLSDEHSLLTVIPVRDNYRTTGTFDFLYATTYPANRIRVIKVIFLLSICLVATGRQQNVQNFFLPSTGSGPPMP